MHEENMDKLIIFDFYDDYCGYSRDDLIGFFGGGEP